MGTISDYLENKWIDHVLKTSAYTVPANIYVGLSTADPLDTGANLAEPSGNGYARVQFNTWNAASARAVTNNGAITFPTATGAGWGTCTHLVLFDAASGGNMLGSTALAASKTPGAGDTPSFATTSVSISVTSGVFSNYLANAMLDHTFKITPYTPATNLYVVACTAAPSDSSTGSTITEPAGGSYARTICNAWNVASGGASANTSAITFPAATGNWGTISHSGICDASSAGNLLMYGALAASKSVPSGDTFRFPTGDFDIAVA